MGLLQRKRAIQPRDSGNAVFRQHDSRWWDIMANPPLAEPIDEVKFLAGSEKPRPKGLSLQLLFRGLKPPASTEVGLPSALCFHRGRTAVRPIPRPKGRDPSTSLRAG